MDTDMEATHAYSTSRTYADVARPKRSCDEAGSPPPPKQHKSSNSSRKIWEAFTRRWLTWGSDRDRLFEGENLRLLVDELPDLASVEAAAAMSDEAGLHLMEQAMDNVNARQEAARQQEELEKQQELARRQDMERQQQALLRHHEEQATLESLERQHAEFIQSQQAAAYEASCQEQTARQERAARQEDEDRRAQLKRKADILHENASHATSQSTSSPEQEQSAMAAMMQRMEAQLLAVHAENQRSQARLEDQLRQLQADNVKMQETIRAQQVQNEFLLLQLRRHLSEEDIRNSFHEHQNGPGPPPVPTSQPITSQLPLPSSPPLSPTTYPTVVVEDPSEDSVLSSPTGDHHMA